MLVDTPGFDDTTRTDTEVLRQLADWLSASYHSGVLLAGLIYIHRIMDPRMSGSTLKNLRLFRKLLGDISLRRLILVTSFWDKILPEIGEPRERELTLNESYWGSFVDKGSRVARSYGDRDSALAILDLFLSIRGPGVVLDIQRELVDQGLTLRHTTAGAYMDGEIQRLQSKYSSKIEELREHQEPLFDRQQESQNQQTDPDQPFSATNADGSVLANEVEQVGNREDLNASWNPDYESLWLNEDSNIPPKIDLQIYSRLKKGDIRLVDIRAGERNLPIEISLAIESLDDPPPFGALSYAVGRDQRQIFIKLRHRKTLQDVQIGENLHTALLHLRRTHHDITLWIDALSINQNDNAERAQQINQMTEIFAKAENVCIWLGPATSTSLPSISHDMDVSYSNDVAMKLAKDVLNLENLDATVQNADRKWEFFCLTRLLASPWFTRRWCVQEVVMARNATVHCGEHVMPWPDFVDMAQLLSSRWSEVQASVDTLMQQKVGHAHLIGALALINVSASIVRRTRDEQVVERLVNLESLLKILGMFEVTVSLDAIYSIYNLAKDIVGTEKLPIDYALEPRELFTDVTELIVRTSGNLDIICHPWAPAFPLPSWIPTVERLPYKRRRGGFQYDRQHGIPFVNTPGPVQRYRACGDKSTEGNVQFIKEAKPILSARGLLVASVTELGGQSMNGLIPSDWLRLCGWHETRSENAPEAFWQSIVADQGNASLRAPKWYRRACEAAVRETFSEYIDTELLRRATTSSHVKEYLEKVQDVIWSRSLVKVTIGSRQSSTRDTVCLCPRETQIADIICVLYGCSVPVVLKRQGERYKMIGECFVHGIMDGEALSSTYDLHLEEAIFQIT
jgi:hypothetical protein